MSRIAEQEARWAARQNSRGPRAILLRSAIIGGGVLAIVAALASAAAAGLWRPPQVLVVPTPTYVTVIATVSPSVTPTAVPVTPPATPTATAAASVPAPVPVETTTTQAPATTRTTTKATTAPASTSTNRTTTSAPAPATTRATTSAPAAGSKPSISELTCSRAGGRITASARITTGGLPVDVAWDLAGYPTGGTKAASTTSVSAWATDDGPGTCTLTVTNSAGSARASKASN